MTTDEVKKQIFDLVKKNRMQLGFQIQFPIYNILPDEVKLAMNILSKHGMKISFTLEQK